MLIQPWSKVMLATLFSHSHFNFLNSKFKMLGEKKHGTILAQLLARLNSELIVICTIK